MRPPVRTCLIGLGGVLLALPSFGDCLFVNASTSPTNQVVAFQVGAGGSLTLVPGSPFATNGGGQGHGILTVGDRLYVVNESYNGGGSISGFTILSGCSLTLLPGSPWPAGVSPSGLAADAQGSRLYAGSFNDGEIWSYDIEANGSLTLLENSATEPNPLELEVDGDRLFASHLFEGTGAYYCSAEGSLIAAPGSPYSSGDPDEQAMRGTALTASASFLYVADSGQDQIAAFAVSGTGTLSHIAGSPFDADIDSPFDVLLSPADDLLFLSTGTGLLGVYAINGSGALSGIAGNPFDFSTPPLNGLARDPLGAYLYSATGFEEADDEVYAFSIASDGTPTELAGSPFAMGTSGNPGWLVYYAGEGQAADQAVPTAAPFGLAALAALLLAGALVALRRH